MMKLLGIVVVLPAVVEASSPEKRLERKRPGPESRPADETKEYFAFPKKTAEEMMEKASAEYKEEGEKTSPVREEDERTGVGVPRMKTLEEMIDRALAEYEDEGERTSVEAVEARDPVGVVYPQGHFERLYNPLAFYSVPEKCVSGDLAICLSAHDDTTAELSFGFNGTHGFFETRVLKVALDQPDDDGVMTAVVQPESPHQIEDLREVTSMPTLREIGVRYPVSEDPLLLDIILRRGARTRRERSECSVRLVRVSTKVNVMSASDVLGACGQPLHGREADLWVESASLTGKERLESLVGAFDENVVDSGVTGVPHETLERSTEGDKPSLEDFQAWLDDAERKEGSSLKEKLVGMKGDRPQSASVEGVQGLSSSGESAAPKKEKDGITVPRIDEGSGKHSRPLTKQPRSKRPRINARGQAGSSVVVLPGETSLVERASVRGEGNASEVDPGRTSITERRADLDLMPRSRIGLLEGEYSARMNLYKITGSFSARIICNEIDVAIGNFRYTSQGPGAWIGDIRLVPVPSSTGRWLRVDGGRVEDLDKMLSRMQKSFERSGMALDGRNFTHLTMFIGKDILERRDDDEKLYVDFARKGGVHSDYYRIVLEASRGK
ncbi:hypothetical protein FOZ62_020770 [Perkinsus olseni]|uniref:Uncharacterized protein n=1 Tax=Perkinsus olseni TaxID=32597 RepID=A0A7J6T9K6_PEROL|nr:hypothetical protein FOZ62_020770 [Perkinsus olseni]